MADCRNATPSWAPIDAWTKPVVTPPAPVTTPPAQVVTSTAAGILRPEQLARYVTLTRHPATGPCDYWVENYWSLAWDLPSGVTHRSEVLPHPACNLSVERGRTRPGVTAPVVVTGVVTRRFDTPIAGQGYVVAAKFRPGGLAALIGQGVRDLRDGTRPALGYLPDATVAALATITADVPVRAGIERMASVLAEASAGTDPRYESLLGVIQDMLTERSLQQVTQVAARHGLSVRGLQRLFDHYVGVSPKWVLARYRMHDALADLDAGYDGSFADLAASLGWFDQAHFTRDFVALVGVTPGAYRDRDRPANDRPIGARPANDRPIGARPANDRPAWPVESNRQPPRREEDPPLH